MSPKMMESEIFVSLVTGAGGSITVGGIFFYFLRAALSDIKKISPLENRVLHLEGRQINHDKTSEEVIRMSEQIKYLTQEVRHLADMLSRKGS